jgi:hypothetical protein
MDWLVELMSDWHPAVQFVFLIIITIMILGSLVEVTKNIAIIVRGQSNGKDNKDDS